MNRKKMIEGLLYLDDPVADQAVNYIQLLERTLFMQTQKLCVAENDYDIALDTISALARENDALEKECVEWGTIDGKSGILSSELVMDEVGMHIYPLIINDLNNQSICKLNSIKAQDYHEGSDIQLCQGIKSKVQSVWNINGDIWLLLENGIGVKCCK